MAWNRPVIVPGVTRATKAFFETIFDGIDDALVPGRCHIIPGLGQSNMTQSDTAVVAGAEDVRLKKWNGASIVPLPTSDSYALPTFAREYVRTIPNNDWVLIVPAAVGSTSFTSTSVTPVPAGFTSGTGTWDRTHTADPVNLAQQAVDKTLAAKAAALAMTTDVHIPVMLFSGFEGDTPRLSEDEFSAKLDDLLNWFKIQVASPNMHVLLGSMVPEYGYARGQTYTAAVAAGIARTPARVQRSAFAWGPEGYAKKDEIIHYSTAGQIVRGKLFMEALERARVNVKNNKPSPPQNVTAERAVSGRVTARWTPPLSREVSLEAQFTVDNGTTWTAMAVDRDSRRRATTVTVPTNIVRVRVRTIGDAGVVSDWAYSEFLFAVSGAPAPTEAAAPVILDPPIPGDEVRVQFVGGENVSPAKTGAATLYIAFTLPAGTAGGVTVNARSNDSTRGLMWVATQSAAPSLSDLARSITGSGDMAVSYPDPRAVAGPHVNAVSVTADGKTLFSRRGNETGATQTLTTGTGGPLIEALRATIVGGAVLHGAYIYYGVAHTPEQMAVIQEELRALHGLAAI